MKLRNVHGSAAILAAILFSPFLHAQSTHSYAGLTLHLARAQQGTRHAGHPGAPAVLWLEALEGTPALPFPPDRRLTMLQKDRSFTPHLLIVPVGSSVQFPNADPFFHNVFSLFDGKRFDLGLYEAGSSKAVTFSREGVSYIFCNIHPEMSAVVIALATPLYAVADANGSIALSGVPPGNYLLHIWVEGVSPLTLEAMSRRVHLAPGTVDLGEWKLPAEQPSTHTNKFGQAYDPAPNSTY